MNFILEIKDKLFRIHKADESPQKEITIKSIFLGLKDGVYQITITFFKSKRSLKQNHYYWGVVVPFVKEVFNLVPRITPMTERQAHLQFKDLAGCFEDVQVYDKETKTLELRRLYDSFSNAGDLTAEDFINVVDKVRVCISDMTQGQYVLPEPDREYKKLVEEEKKKKK